MKSKAVWHVMFGLGALLLSTWILMGCSSSASQATSPEGVPEGVYWTNVPGTDFEVNLANGRYTMTWGGHVASKGPYASNRELLVLVGEPVTGEALCKESEDPGIYKWAVQNQQLILTKIQDFCLYREGSLTDRPLIKKK